MVDHVSPAVTATLDPETFAVLEAAAAGNSGGGDPISLEPAAVMYTVLQGVAGSMGHLPRAPVMGPAGTFVADPEV